MASWMAKFSGKPLGNDRGPLAQNSLIRISISSYFISWCPKEACFGGGQWSTLVTLVKNRRAIGDYLSAPTLSAELADIDEKYAAEIKEKKKQLKKAAGEQHEEEGVVVQEPEPTEETPEAEVLPHMLIGEEASLPIKEDKLDGDNLEKA